MVEEGVGQRKAGAAMARRRRPGRRDASLGEDEDGGYGGFGGGDAFFSAPLSDLSRFLPESAIDTCYWRWRQRASDAVPGREGRWRGMWRMGMGVREGEGMEPTRAP